MRGETDICLDDGDHVVQFYDGDVELVAVVGPYLEAAITAGDAVVVIATPEHRAALEPFLAGGPEAVVLDAADLLAQFMVGGSPDAERFAAIVGGIVRRAGAGRPVRAYGEMVALLWAEGNVTGAIAVEELWNDLGARVPFSLFCAYPAHLLDGAALDAVCHLHTAVVGDAPVPPGVEAWRQFPRSPQACRAARVFVADSLTSWDLEGLVADATLVASELAANAVLHARSGFSVSLTRIPGGVRLTVGDTSPCPPAPRVPGPEAPGGRGLHILAAMAPVWGHDLTGSGKLVWAELTG